MKFLLILLVGLCSEPKDCAIPEPIEQLLNQELPEIELVYKSALVEDWNQFLESDCPTIAKGDFNGDGMDDYAFITTNTNPEPYQLLVVQSKKGSYELAKIMDIGFGIYDGGLGFGIEICPKGKVHGISKEITLTNEGILFKKFESSSQVIYFDRGNYLKIWTGD